MRSLLVLAGLAVSLSATPQDIYRWVDKDGIVHYSDQPGSSKAELITVVEPNAYESADVTPYGSPGDAPDDSAADRGASPYGTLSIVSPQQDQVFFGADATVSAQVDMRGTVQPDDTLVFFLNGERRPASGNSLELAGLDRGTYFLRASILDQNGKPVATSNQVTFHVRQPSILSPQSPQAPKPPKPTPKPTPKPAPKPRN